MLINQTVINCYKLLIIIVPFTVERDLKLMTSILGIEHYTLIMLGAITVSKEVFRKSNICLKML